MTNNGDVSTGQTVGRVSRLLGVSVRTLHHWDDIGLVCASDRTPAGYRLYSVEDIARSHRVLVYRELGFPLAEIEEMLDDPATDRVEQLRRQRDLLNERISRLHEIVSAVDHMVEAYERGSGMTQNDLAEIFGADYNPEYQEEARQRWGDTTQWEQSQQRAGNMTADQWKVVRAEMDELHADLIAAKRAEVSVDSAEVAALVERHRESISTFYDCSHSMQVCLGRMYVQDPRFTAYYDEQEPGLAAWLSAAIDANARAHGIDPDNATWE